MAEHELNGQIKSASLAQQHIVTSENCLKRAADPKIELPTHLLPTTFVLIAAGRQFQSTHPFWNFRYGQNVTQREPESVPKLQSGYINVAGAIVIKVVASQWVAFRVWVELAFLREQKDTVVFCVLHLDDFRSVPWEKRT